MDPDTTSTKTQTRRSPLNEEQLLCHEALESSAFDSISDDQWVAMCELVASKGRRAIDPEQISALPGVEEDED